MQLSSVQQDLINDGMKELTDSSAFTGVTSYASGPSYSFQGSNYGYTSGGFIPGASNVIDKFPFLSDANATDVGDLTVARGYVVGQSSSASGYSSGGYGPATSNVIDKFSFPSDGNATDVGDLTVARYNGSGQSSSENGYTSGGSPNTNVIDKFPFASDANASDVGDLFQAYNYSMSGQSSTTHGYNSGGHHPSPPDFISNVIEKFPFASDANASDVGDLIIGTKELTGQSSTLSGYTSGGLTVPPGSPIQINTIQKFPFSSDGNSTDVGDLTVARRYGAGQSSTLSGYTSGGFGPITNVIDKFPFSSDANATDVGDLTVGRYGTAGQQY